MLVCVHVVMKDLLPQVEKCAYAMIYFGGNEVIMKGGFGMMRCMCDWLGWCWCIFLMIIMVLLLLRRVVDSAKRRGVGSNYLSLWNLSRRQNRVKKEQ